MPVITSICKAVVDALFPLSPAERKLFSHTPQSALRALPTAPTFSAPSVSISRNQASAVFAYKDERVAKLIWNVKYKKSRPAIAIGGYALWCALQETETWGTSGLPRAGTAIRPEVPQVSHTSGIIPPILIPMPITTKRRRERGYNQCELLTTEIKKLDVENHFQVRTDILMRVQHTSRQTLKSRTDRLESAKGIFSVDTGAVKNVS